MTTKKAAPRARANGEGSTFPLSDSAGNLSGKWRAQATLKNAETGKRKYVTKTCASRKAAEAALIELETLYPGGVWTPRTIEEGSAPGTVGALLDEWDSERVSKNSATTAQNYRSAMKYIRVSDLANMSASEVTEQDVNLFLQRLTTLNESKPRPLTPRSKNLVRKVLAMAYKYGRSIDASLATNPARDAEVPAQDNSTEADDEIDQRWFEDDEVKRFFEAVRKVAQDDPLSPEGQPQLPLSAAWAIQYHLGLRPGEVRALAWDDLDLDATPPTLHVQRGQKRAGGVLVARGKTKNRASIRRLAVPGDLLPWLEAHKALQKAQRAPYEGDARWNPDSLLFTRADGTPVSSEAYRRAFQKVCTVADIHDATPYALRHTCATHMVHNGVPLHVIASLLGHTDLSMLTKVYGHLLTGTVVGYEGVLTNV